MKIFKSVLHVMHVILVSVPADEMRVMDIVARLI